MPPQRSQNASGKKRYNARQNKKAKNTAKKQEHISVAKAKSSAVNERRQKSLKKIGKLDKKKKGPQTLGKF